jgi:hypothetical protein
VPRSKQLVSCPQRPLGPPRVGIQWRPMSQSGKNKSS